MCPTTAWFTPSICARRDFHDGTPVNARRGFTFERQTNPEHPYHDTGEFRTPSSPSEHKTIEVVDDLTVRITLNETFARSSPTSPCTPPPS